ncbi:uncharacterized protein LOC126844865 [Adelges cooleyi]|uniref:uncharacterized protein LOC126844865 n=1 Tax=Adelges cooleyi TaxID=133065 RepID=UPI0021807C55|nr:uncharacterized protein LOC126844865 [Adelges cooleyi]
MSSNSRQQVSNVTSRGNRVFDTQNRSAALNLYKRCNNPKRHLFSEIASEFGIQWSENQRTSSTLKCTSVAGINTRPYEGVNEFVKTTIRQIVRSFYVKRKLPTVEKVYSKVKKRGLLPFMKKKFFADFLKSLKFKLIKTKTHGLALTEKKKIVLWRRRCLNKIMQYRQEGRTIYYLDETWIDLDEKKHISDTQNKILFLLHICTSRGFVPGGLLCVEMSKDKLYTDYNAFLIWFEDILPSLDPNGVIVMNKKPFNLFKYEQIPNKHWKKENISRWLEEKKIKKNQENMLKIEMLNIVKKHKNMFNIHMVDETAKRYQKEVLRLPRYHGEMNLMTFVWSLIKDEISNNNTASDVYDLVSGALSKMTHDNWKYCNYELQYYEKEFQKLDVVMDEVLDDTDFGTDHSSRSLDYYAF